MSGSRVARLRGWTARIKSLSPSSSSPFENLAPQYYLPTFSHCRRLQLSSIPDGPLCLRWCVARPTLYLSLAFPFHRLRTKRPRDTVWQVRRSVRAPQVPRPGPGAGLASVDLLCCPSTGIQ